MLTRFLAAPALLAAASLIATPAVAVELPVVSHAPVEATSHYGPYVSVGVGGGWGRGWGGYRGRHHRRGSTAGDILTGVLILGTIAAVANAFKRNERRPYPERYPDPDRRYDRPSDYRADGPRNGPQGLEGAADLCLREVERNARAREVTRVERNAGGWLVTGSMTDGAAFSCSIGGDGRIESIDVGGRAQDRAQGLSVEDRQYDDDRYRSARAEIDGGDVTPEAGPQPEYPGGPLPGEEFEGEASPEI